MSKEPKYCIACDTVQVVYAKDKVVLQYLSDGVVVRTQDVVMRSPKAGDTLDIHIHCFIPVEEKPPVRYSVDDLMKMLAEKGVWKS